MRGRRRRRPRRVWAELRRMRSARPQAAAGAKAALWPAACSRGQRRFPGRALAGVFGGQPKGTTQGSV